MHKETLQDKELYEIHKLILSKYLQTDICEPIDDHPLHGQSIEDEMTKVLQEMVDKQARDKEQINKLDLV